MKSHTFEEPLEWARSLHFCGVCKSKDCVQRCLRCGRCDVCGRTIFCKGAERTEPEPGPNGHVNRLSERMDRAIWDAFRFNVFEPVLALVEGAGLSVNFKRASKSETALMAAAYNGNYE
eukprot:32598-Eustigmatos_ZCMA.PRE.1